MSSSTANGEPLGLGALTPTEAFRARALLGIEEVSTAASMDEVLLDADRLSFPMELRPWRHGDRIRPIGLHGTKLVSDILIDAKVPRSEKPSTCSVQRESKK